MNTPHVPRPSDAHAAATTTHTTPPASVMLPLPPLTPCTLLETLFDAAQPHLSARQLDEIASQSSEMAQDIACRAASLARGVGCFVPADMTSPVGGFWTENDLSGLLGHFGDVFQHVAGLVSVSRTAHHARKAKP